MKKVLFLWMLLVPVSLYAGTIGDNLEFAGFLKTDVWVQNNTNNMNQHLSMLKDTVDLAVEYKFNDNWYFFIHGRYFYDFAYGIRENEDFDSNQALMSQTQRDDWLRDCYLDFISDNLDLRFGKQQVVWGQMDIPILDRVMPADLTQWFLPDLADIRIPLWGVKAEYSPVVDSTFQVVIFPDFEASRIAPPGAPFSIKSYNDFAALMDSLPVLVQQNRVFLNDIGVENQDPAMKFTNSTFGLRWRSMIGDLEYTLNWLYGYHYTAALYEARTIASVQLPPIPPNIRLHSDYYRQHKRIQMAGGSFAKTFVNPGPLEGITIKGEFAYIHDEPTYYGTPGSREMTERSNKFNYGLAAEKTLFTNWTFSFQFLQFITEKEHFTDDTTGIEYNVLDAFTYGLADKMETSYVLKVMTDFMHERIMPEITILYNASNHGRIVPEVNFEVRDNFWVTVGYAHFFGREDTSNGQFRNRDQAYVALKYTF